jgi:hypothetical protein
MTKPEQRCVYCAYIIDLQSGRSVQTIDGPRLAGTKTSKGKAGRHSHVTPAPLAVEIVETPNGPRPLCAKHARDAVRA